MTLNQLLVEMDGFGVNEGIIVMAATNRVDILDPAILRPGRFDRKVAVGRPDVKGREEILGVHTKEKPLGEDVDLHRIAQTTAGFTGADLENLMNEAAINTAKEGRKFLTQTDIEKAFIKVGIGAEKRSKVISEKDKKITAYHEAGHAILFHVLPDVGPVHTVSIIPTGVGAAGYTMPLPEQDELHMTKGRMLQNIMVSLGGRIAEEIIFDDITTGASQDIKRGDLDGARDGNRVRYVRKTGHDQLRWRQQRGLYWPRPGAYENLQRGSGERDRQRGKTHHRRMLCQGKTDHSRSRGCPSFLLCPADGEREDRSG